VPKADIYCAAIRDLIGASIDVIFVSLAEHYAPIIADEGIARKVHHSEWQAAIDALDRAYARRSDRRRLHRGN